ncbi:MAG: class I SAM-dependent methyltransferase [Proteobacteria bacterium]|nr:class I SAM-dependent methyltransferase [Pseudomonadota bacterium]
MNDGRDEAFPLSNRSAQTEADLQFKSSVAPHFEGASGTTLDKLNHFPRFVPRQSLALFMARQGVFQHIVEVHGAVIECGVFMGGGLFTWAQLSAILEPVNHNRRIVGFDSFDGFPGLSPQDLVAAEATEEYKQVGAYRYDGQAQIEHSAALYDLNRPVGHIPRVELVRGDATRTIPSWVEGNPHVVVALLHLDFDLYEPTVAALRAFLPRMPRGAVIAFDELNQKQWPGETLAVLEEVGLSRLRIRRFPWTPNLSYAVLED